MQSLHYTADKFRSPGFGATDFIRYKWLSNNLHDVNGQHYLWAHGIPHVRYNKKLITKSAHQEKTPVLLFAGLKPRQRI
ncbi:MULTISPECIES: hypothetical protein [Photorhabdus]|uniref:hypothetical protein n=1 Tax=Photorhabdus TaxID=29487 RepID=UPI000DCB20BC|nr:MULTISPECIES: hypothetical protein [Photorhabdus]MCT8342064.1 hypothetical protein [Photorhabdus kleinii]RAW94093.1 hypothetical protein CKY03_20940 [Photorhabdus sp. S9-53]RAW94248.1 hypothetical protein CKY05_20725 [Photorhabdus sp. S10-54]RAW97914.1 hypothetical protein CKY04_20620 [Photorhabdus sp. S8-52]